MTLEEIKAKLGDDTDGIGAAIEALIKAESEKFISVKSKLNKEAESVRSRLKKTLDVLGYETGDIDEYLESYKSKSSQTVEQKNTLEKQIAEIKGLLDRERKEKETIAIKTKHKTIESALKDAFKNVSGAQYVIKSLIADNIVDLGENEQPKFMFDGEEYDFKRGVQKFLDDNRDLVNIKQSGSGTSGAAAASQKKTLTRKEFNALSIEQGAEFLKTGDVVD